MSGNKTGSCLCGAVKFAVTGPLRAVIACHCHQCRKQTGNYMSATGVKDQYLELTETRGLKWYRSSDKARRGFCSECGSGLWSRDRETGDIRGVRMGTFDSDPGVRPSRRHYVDFAAPWEPIPDDGLPRYAERRP